MLVHTKKRRINTKKAEEFLQYDWRETYKDLLSKTPEGGLVLQGYRYREDITQRELAKIIGSKQSHISEMERGLRPIGKQMAKKLARAFNTDYRVFL